MKHNLETVKNNVNKLLSIINNKTLNPEYRSDGYINLIMYLGNTEVIENHSNIDNAELLRDLRNTIIHANDSKSLSYKDVFSLDFYNGINSYDELNSKLSTITIAATGGRLFLNNRDEIKQEVSELVNKYKEYIKEYTDPKTAELAENRYASIIIGHVNDMGISLESLKDRSTEHNSISKEYMSDEEKESYKSTLQNSIDSRDKLELSRIDLYSHKDKYDHGKFDLQGYFDLESDNNIGTQNNILYQYDSPLEKTKEKLLQLLSNPDRLTDEFITSLKDQTVYQAADLIYNMQERKSQYYNNINDIQALQKKFDDEQKDYDNIVLSKITEQQNRNNDLCNKVDNILDLSSIKLNTDNLTLDHISNIKDKDKSKELSFTYQFNNEKQENIVTTEQLINTIYKKLIKGDQNQKITTNTPGEIKVNFVKIGRAHV